MDIFSNKNSNIAKGGKGHEPEEPNEMIELKKELEVCQAKAAEYLNGWKRSQADFVNYKKRQEESLASWLIFAKTGLIKELFPILDSFNAALKDVPAVPDEKARKWTEGIIKTAKEFLKILNKAGLEEIRSVGEKFNPEFHEALDSVPSDKEVGIVLEEVQKGYRFSGKVIRTAKVRVSAKKRTD